MSNLTTLQVAGVPIMGAQGLLTPGQSYFVDPVIGSDDNAGDAMDCAKKSLAVAYALLRDGYHDVLYYIGGTSGLSLAATLTWSKSYAHFIGLNAPVHDGQRSRVGHSADMTTLITLSGSGCIFSNLRTMYGRGTATNVKNLTVTGSRNLIHRVNLGGPMHATEGGAATYANLFINGGAENLFKECTIGSDTVARTGSNYNLLLDTGAARNKFEDCLFSIMCGSGGTGATHVAAADTSAIDRYLWFHNCLFYNFSVNRGYTQTKAFSIPAGHQTCEIIFTGKGTGFVNCTDIGDANSDVKMWFMPDTATQNAALLALAPAVS